jgi:hypothetical protein
MKSQPGHVYNGGNEPRRADELDEFVGHLK